MAKAFNSGKKKHFHHKPVFGGALTGAILNNVASVTGNATCTVLNSPHDSSFYVENPGQEMVYPGAYGTFAIDHFGNWTYLLNETMAPVSGLATGATLTDSFLVRSEYDYRGSTGVEIVITITGH